MSAEKNQRVLSNYRRVKKESETARSSLSQGQERAPTDAPLQSPHGFNFRATSSDGASVPYYVPVEDEALAMAALQNAGMKVERIRARRSVRKRRARIPRRPELQQLAEQIGDMWEAGEPPTQILTSLSLSSPNPLVSKALMNVSKAVSDGATVSEALALQTTVTANPSDRARERDLARGKKGRPVFPITLCHAVSIAELTGAITDPITKEKRGAMQWMMRQFAEAQARLDSLWTSVKSALAYPVAVIVVIICVIFIMLYFALPQFKMMYEAMTNGGQLPWPTRFLIAASDFATSPLGGVMIVGIVASAVAFVLWTRTDRGWDWVQERSLWIPLFGELMRETNMATLARNLGMLASGSGDIIFALRETARSMTNPAYRRMLESVRYEFERQARPLDVLFRPYTPLVTESFHTILVTYDRSGGLDALCTRFAIVLENRCERRIEKLKRALNTYMIIPLAIIAAGVLIALYAPMSDLVGKMANAH